MRQPELALTGRRALPGSRSYALSKRELLVITLVVLVPVPLFAVSGLNFPLPGIVQRVAASLVPGIRGAFGVGDPEPGSSRAAAIRLAVEEPRPHERSAVSGPRSLATGSLRLDAGSVAAAKALRTGARTRRVNVVTSTSPPSVRPTPGEAAVPLPSDAASGGLTASTVPSGGGAVAIGGGSGVGGATESPWNLAPDGGRPDSGNGSSGGIPVPDPPATVDDGGVTVALPDGPAGVGVGVSAGTSGAGGSDGGGALGLGETSTSAEVTLPGGATAEVTATLPVGVNVPALGGGDSSSGGASGSSGDGAGGGSGGSGSAGGLGVSLGIGLGSK